MNQEIMAIVLICASVLGVILFVVSLFLPIKIWIACNQIQKIERDNAMILDATIAVDNHICDLINRLEK
jgi:low affinity Fe/Cu permease